MAVKFLRFTNLFLTDRNRECNSESGVRNKILNFSFDSVSDEAVTNKVVVIF